MYEYIVIGLHQSTGIHSFRITSEYCNTVHIRLTSEYWIMYIVIGLCKRGNIAKDLNLC